MATNTVWTRLPKKVRRSLFMILADKTSGKETYPAGRYLYVDPPDASGRMIIDFNKAFSPPVRVHKVCHLPAPAAPESFAYRD